jgi:hypothetical protein
MSMHKHGGTKNRGRTPGASHQLAPNPTHPNVAQTLRADATRPIGRGTKHRGDRRDTNPQYTGNLRHQPNFSDPLGSGKKQIQHGGKAMKGGGKRQKGTYDH